jgi:prepilin-type N-terminal cleavage/methylation domain-containing protein
MEAPERPRSSSSSCRFVAGAGGFSLVELLVVVGLIAVTAAVAVLAMPGLTKPIKADSEVQRLVAALRQGRDEAVTQRRNVLVQFPGTSQLELARQNVSGGSVTGTTVVAAFAMEGGFEYRVFPELPDTPDGFGNARARDFSGATSILFTSEGALVDQTGDPVNGTLFIGLEGQPLTARAVTILGTTGLVTAYRWNGREWTR